MPGTWVDAHVHLGADQGGESSSADEIRALFAEDWLDRAVVFCMDEADGVPAGNDRVRRFAAEDDRVAPLLRVDPAVHDPEDIADADWAAGLKLHPRAQAFGMQRVSAHLRAAGERDLPVLVHTGVGDTTGRQLAHPEEVLEAAAVHPDTTIILAHMTKGYYFHAPAFRERFQSLDNAYIDTSLHCTPLGIETVVDDLGADRVLYASDHPYGHPVPMQANLRYADIPDEAAEQVAWRNADRLFF